MRDLLGRSTLSDTLGLVTSLLWKKCLKKKWPLILTDNVWLEKWKFISNLIIPTSSNSTQHSQHKKQFTSWWNCAVLEIFMKNFEFKDHFHKRMLNQLSDRFVQLLTTYIKWTSFTEISKLKTLFFMETLLNYVILDGRLKDNNQESHFVEHQFTFLLKLSRTRVTTTKLMSGVWVYWLMNLFMERLPLIFDARMTYKK